MKKITMIALMVALGLSTIAQAKTDTMQLMHSKTFCQKGGPSIDDKMLPKNFQPIASNPKARYSWQYAKGAKNCYIAAGYEAKNKKAVNDAGLQIAIIQNIPTSKVAGPANDSEPILKAKVVCMLDKNKNLTSVQAQTAIKKGVILGKPFAAGKHQKCYVVINEDHRATTEDLQQLYFAVSGTDISF